MQGCVVIRPGSYVFIGIGNGVSEFPHRDIPAVVSGVCVDKDGISYKCVWYDGRTRKEEWLLSNEVELINPESKMLTIGFK